MAGGPAKGSGRSDAPDVDWKRAARLLAGGLSITATAERVGCSRSRLSRRKNGDETFKSWLECHRGGVEPEPQVGLADLRDAVHRAIEAEVQRGNVRVILWLADRMKLVSVVEQRAPADQLDRLLRDLSPSELVEFQSLQDDS